MNIPALIVGLLAVACFVFSYALKSRKSILFFNLTSRVLYILQYLLLAAFEGAVLDVLGALSVFLAQQADRPWLKKHRLPIFLLVHLSMVVAGGLLYQNIFSLFPLVGILLQAGAMWLRREGPIRLISMLGCPFWFTYNFVSGAYGSCVGDLLALASLVYAFVRYNIKEKNGQTANQGGKTV